MFLEFDIQVGEEQLVLIERIDADGDRRSTSAEIVIVAPTIVIRQVHAHGVTQHVSRLSHNAFHVLPAVKNIVIDQIRVERVLLRKLIINIELPIVLFLQLANSGAALKRITLIAMSRSYDTVGKRGRGGIRPRAALKIGGKIAK